MLKERCLSSFFRAEDALVKKGLGGSYVICPKWKIPRSHRDRTMWLSLYT